MIRKYQRGYPQFSKHWNEWSDLSCFGKLFNEILSKHDKLLVNKLKKKAENQLNALGKILTKQEKAINQRLLEDASFLLGLIETELNEIG